MKKLVLASNNQGKLKEFQGLLLGCGYEVLPQAQYQVESVEETGLSFIENAILKARHACARTGLPALSDDSGIEVDALKGAPGIYSARFAGEDACDRDNNQKLLSELHGLEASERTARYHCVLVLMRHEHDPTPIVAQGHWEGHILTEARGDGGFGYDPLFWVASHNCSAAQLDKQVKNSISHRAQAIRDLMIKLPRLLS